MKRISLLLGAVLLSGCAATGTGENLTTEIGKTLFAEAVNYKCRSELNNQAIYQTVSLLMTKEQKEKLESKTCSCVARQAPESVTLEEMATAAIDSKARTKIVAGAVSKTIGTCISEIVSKI